MRLIKDNSIQSKFCLHLSEIIIKIEKSVRILSHKTFATILSGIFTSFIVVFLFYYFYLLAINIGS